MNSWTRLAHSIGLLLEPLILMLCMLQEGHTINLHHFGGIDLSKLQGKMSMERFWQTVLVNCEALPREVLPAAAQAAGKPILGTCVVVDLSGFGCVSYSRCLTDLG